MYDIMTNKYCKLELSTLGPQDHAHPKIRTLDTPLGYARQQKTTPLVRLDRQKIPLMLEQKNYSLG